MAFPISNSKPITMDQTQLHLLFENTYIPSQHPTSTTKSLAHHPSLIMFDNQTDTTHHLSCGCCGGCCIEQQAWWADSKSVKAKSIAARSHCYTANEQVTKDSANFAKTSLQTVFSKESKRPDLKRFVSNTSISSVDTHSNS